MRPEITLIKKSGPNPVMSKRIFLDEQGKLCSGGSQCLMTQGTANAPRLKRLRTSPHPLKDMKGLLHNG
jgi:hypothetical protein